MTCNTLPYDRVFLELGPFTIYWYGVIIATGAFLGLLLAMRESDRLGLNKDLFVDLLVFAIPAAIIGARTYYVIFEWERYQGGPWWDVFAIWEGGIAIHGALIASIITAVLYARAKNVSFWQLADIAAPSLILGQAIGRWGNFMNQEAYGGPVSPEAYENVLRYVPDFIMNQMCVDGVLHHPTFLYESVWNILGLIFLLFLRKINPRRGEIFFGYLIWYSIGRFFIEGMRTDSLYLGDFRVAQLISVGLILASVVVMIYRRKAGYADQHYDGSRVTTGRR
ncbi:prolipoprotein diacylglyceryl transferase [Melghiribacillus thermohalophilus]|uniref:Phosphatidylglycerol--prolipoprotein diacylglyceryl transferase n=1 Tax=Melghiribacillus thermohalophilus TaxID=1324956 RepID=A0A4R3MSR4_9BACI|nr:prolipoprotein diacylglyceryl transferase [Melghiribacillus thermohalophilus]TCT18767.1 prolipoprotein diacylglyceryl transferase [Melghiribacillus thermohalophilus]